MGHTDKNRAERPNVRRRPWIFGTSLGILFTLTAFGLQMMATEVIARRMMKRLDLEWRNENRISALFGMGWYSRMESEQYPNVSDRIARHYAEAYYATADSLHRLRDSLAANTNSALPVSKDARPIHPSPTDSPLIGYTPQSFYETSQRRSQPTLQSGGDIVFFALLFCVFALLGLAVYLSVLHPLVVMRGSHAGASPSGSAGLPRIVFAGGGLLLLAITVPALFYCWAQDPGNLKRSIQVALLCATGGLALWYMRTRHERFSDPYDALQFMGGAVGLPNTAIAVFMRD